MPIPSHVLREVQEEAAAQMDACLPRPYAASIAWGSFTFQGSIPPGLYEHEGQYYTTRRREDESGWEQWVAKTKSGDPRDPYTDIEYTCGGDTPVITTEPDTYSGQVDVDALRQNQWDFVKAFVRAGQPVPPVPEYGGGGSNPPWVIGGDEDLTRTNSPDDFAWTDLWLTADLTHWSPGSWEAKIRRKIDSNTDDIFSATWTGVARTPVRIDGLPRTPAYYFVPNDTARVWARLSGSYIQSESLPTGSVNLRRVFGIYRLPNAGQPWSPTSHPRMSIPRGGIVEYEWPAAIAEMDWGVGT